MKHPFFAIFILLTIVLLAVHIPMCAKSLKFPSGKFVSYQFTRGGGMDPLDFTTYYLRHDEETGKDLLTISGDCRGEEITVEVDDEVFDHCLKLIRQHKLQRSKGYYEPLFQLLDAPSSSFTILFEEPFQIISGSGDMPSFLWDGINDIHRYFKSIIGDRKAEGHVDRIYGADGVKGLSWTDGINTFTTATESFVELKKALRGITGNDDREPQEMGYSHFHDGDQHYVHILDYKNDCNRLYYSFDGSDVSRAQMVRRQLTSLLCGTYMDGDGQRYLFTVDGFCKGPKDTEPQPFIIFPDLSKPDPQYRWKGKMADDFRLTTDGFDIIRTSGRAKATVIGHLKRIVENDEVWPVVNERFLSQPMMDALTMEQLEQMLKSIHSKPDTPFTGMQWFTDIGGVNHDLLISEMKKRKKD